MSTSSPSFLTLGDLVRANLWLFLTGFLPSPKSSTFLFFSPVSPFSFVQLLQTPTHHQPPSNLTGIGYPWLGNFWFKFEGRLLRELDLTLLEDVGHQAIVPDLRLWLVQWVRWVINRAERLNYVFGQAIHKREVHEVGICPFGGTGKDEAPKQGEREVCGMRKALFDQVIDRWIPT